MTFVGEVTPALLSPWLTNSQSCRLEVLPCGRDLYFVVADLNGAKDTVRCELSSEAPISDRSRILADLNAAFQDGCSEDLAQVSHFRHPSLRQL